MASAQLRAVIASCARPASASARCVCSDILWAHSAGATAAAPGKDVEAGSDPKVAALDARVAALLEKPALAQYRDQLSTREAPSGAATPPSAGTAPDTSGAANAPPPPPPVPPAAGGATQPAV